MSKNTFTKISFYILILSDPIFIVTFLKYPLDFFVLLLDNDLNPIELSIANISQISYLLVVILELNSVSEIQYKNVMITDDKNYQ